VDAHSASQDRRGKPVVMIVDDDEELLGELGDVLAAEGFRTIIFSDSVAASRSVASVAPDLVLLDLRMPGKSGFELAKEIAGDPATHRVPILAMSAFDVETEARGVAPPTGIRKYFAKPLLLDDLLREIRSQLKKTDGRGT